MKGGNGKSERLPQVLFYVPFNCVSIVPLAFEDDIPTCDQAAHTAESERLEEGAQPVHLHRVSADVDRAQKCDVASERKGVRYHLGVKQGCDFPAT